MNVVARWMDDPALCTKEKMESLLLAFRISNLSEKSYTLKEAIQQLYKGRHKDEYGDWMCPLDQDMIKYLSVPSADVEEMFKKVVDRACDERGCVWDGTNAFGPKKDRKKVKEAVAWQFQAQREIVAQQPDFKKMVQIHLRLLREARTFSNKHPVDASYWRACDLTWKRGQIKASIRMPKKRGHLVLKSPADLPAFYEMLEKSAAFLEGAGKRRVIQRQIDGVRCRIKTEKKRHNQELASLQEELEELQAELPR